MHALKAYAKDGRLVLDEPTDLPDGAVVYLVPIGDDDGMDDDERAQLDASLELSLAQARAGQLVDAGEVNARLSSRG